MKLLCLFCLIPTASFHVIAHNSHPNNKKLKHHISSESEALKSDLSSSSVSTNGPPPPTSHLDKKSLDSLRDVATPDLKSGKPSDVICIED